jgi:hypothetical protein
MKKLLRRLVLVGAFAGAVVAVRSYLGKSGASAGREEVEISFDDGTTQVLGPDSVEAQEFGNLARKILEVGL